MTVVILHQSDELNLINLQKNLLNELNNSHYLPNNLFFYEVNPLWIFLNEEDFTSTDKITLKYNSKKISSIIFNSINFINNSISIDITIKTLEKKDIKESLTLLRLYEGKNKHINKNELNEEDINKKIKKIAENIFPLSIKIFRIGLLNKLSSNSFSIKEDVWVKLK